MTNDERDRIIIETRADTKWMRDKLDVHLKKHWQIEMCIYGALITAVVALLFRV